jgi:hypothetical protein
MLRKYGEVQAKMPNLTELEKKKYQELYDAGLHKSSVSMGFVGTMMRWITDGEIQPLQAEKIMTNQLGFERLSEEEQRQFISDNYNNIGVKNVQHQDHVIANEIAKARALKRLKLDAYFEWGIFKKKTQSISQRRQECEATTTQSHYGCMLYFWVAVLIIILYQITRL